MSTPALAVQKYDRKMGGTAAANWKKGVTGAGAAYQRGIADFLGTPASASRVTAYTQGVDAVSAEEFGAATRGKGNKWLENYRRKMTS